MRRKRAFTLTEVIVTVGIVAILLAIILPAVQMARSASRRTDCANNLRQVGIGLHDFHGVHHEFPAGVTSEFGDFPFMSWLHRTLPFTEHNNVWFESTASYDMDSDPFNGIVHTGFMRPIKLFSCASDPRVRSPQFARNERIVGLTSYVGVLGESGENSNGVFYRDSWTRISMIRDGTSNTIMVGERPPSPDNYYGWWYAGYGRNGLGTPDMVLGVREMNIDWEDTASCESGPYHFQGGQSKEFCDLFHFWSFHPSGGNFLFADGSVSFHTYEFDSVIMKFASIAGGEL